MSVQSSTNVWPEKRGAGKMMFVCFFLLVPQTRVRADINYGIRWKCLLFLPPTFPSFNPPLSHFWASPNNFPKNILFFIRTHRQNISWELKKNYWLESRSKIKTMTQFCAFNFIVHRFCVHKIQSPVIEAYLNGICFGSRKIA